MQEFPDFDLSIITEEEEEKETAPEEGKKSYVPVIYVGSTVPVEGALAPEGLVRPRREQTEEGQWVKKEFLPTTSAVSLRVIGYANLIYAEVLKEGINVYLAGEKPEFLFAVKADAKIEPSYAGQELSVYGWSKRSVSYDEPIGGEVVDTIGIFSHVYATDGERLYVIEVSRGDVPSFSAYTATMSASAKQLWDAYTAYRKVLKEPTKENFETLLNALATHPDLLEAAQKAYNNKVGGVAFDNVRTLDKSAIKETIGPLLREKMKTQFHRWLMEQLENPGALFAQVEEGKRLLRSGGILTGSFSPLKSEVPVALTLMRTLVPTQEGIRDGVVMGSVVTVNKEGECNVYINPYQTKVFNLAKGRENVLQNLPKIYAFMSKHSADAYVKRAKELENNGIKVLSPRAVVPQNVGFKVKDEITELAKLYADALGAKLVLIGEEELKLYMERLEGTVAEQYARPKSQVENMKRQYEEVMSELQKEVIEEFQEEGRKRKRNK